MKNQTNIILKCGFSIMFIALFSSLFSQDSGMSFTEGSWKEVLQKAKEENKSVFVDCYTTWCGPCKWMAKNVFPTDSAGRFYNLHFINYKLDMEKGEGPDIAKQYHVNAYPTYLFLTADGAVLHRTVGSKSVKDFVELGGIALDPEKRLSKFSDRYESGNRSPEFLREYANTMNEAGDYETATKIAGEYFLTQDEAALRTKENWKMLQDFVYEADSREFQSVLKNREQFMAQFGDEVPVYITNVASSAIRKAGKDRDEVNLSILLKLVSENSVDPAGAECSARMSFYLAAEMWDKYAEQAIQYIENGYYKSKKTKKEMDELSKKSGSDYAKGLQQSYLQLLNNTAWTFYEHVEDKTSLGYAVKWAKESVSIDAKSYNLDTYAAVLFKYGKLKEGKKQGEKAITKAKEEGVDYSSTTETMEKYLGGSGNNVP